MKTAYLALGSNLGDRMATLQAAVEALDAADLRIVRFSHVYETEPMYLAQQPRFLNMVLAVETTLFPRQLLRRVLQIEQKLGRRRTVRNGPRTLDIDIILYARAVVQTPDLTVPHPRLAERRFVLEPLNELAPDLRHPLLHRTIRELLAEAPPQKIRRVEGIVVPGNRSVGLLGSLGE